MRRIDLARAALVDPAMQAARSAYDALVVDLMDEQERVDRGYPLPSAAGGAASEGSSAQKSKASAS